MKSGGQAKMRRAISVHENRSGSRAQDMTQQWETTVSNEEKPNEKARAIRARQRAIGRELRRMYDDVAQEPVPDDFMDLLRKIDESDDHRSGNDDDKNRKRAS
jgi:hypothetical protein